MDTKWKNRKKAISFMIFFLGVSLAIGGFMGVLKDKPDGVGPLSNSILPAVERSVSGSALTTPLVADVISIINDNAESNLIFFMFKYLLNTFLFLNPYK